MPETDVVKIGGVNSVFSIDWARAGAPASNNASTMT
jgi:hypothetical protein